jgi:hypothetical protein
MAIVSIEPTCCLDAEIARNETSKENQQTLELETRAASIQPRSRVHPTPLFVGRISLRGQHATLRKPLIMQRWYRGGVL